MSTGVRITSNGIEQIDGASGCQISNHSNNKGFAPFPCGPISGSTVTPVGLAFTISFPGFLWVSGSQQCSGTIPAPSLHPGAHIMLACVNDNDGFMLTGSARSVLTIPVFAKNGVGIGSVSTSLGGGVAAGDKLTVPAAGSVALFSDGLRWIPFASSGSLQIQL